MTVKELRERLAGLDPDTHIVITRDTDSTSELFEVGHVDMGVGTPSRSNIGKPLFTFEKD